MTAIGNLLGGRYRLVELLGQGGMATIYRAHDTRLDRDVAVKVLRPEYGADPDFGSRFRQEAQSAASLNHPNVVAVHDFGQDPAGPFIVMELVDGEDLASLVRRAGPLPPRQAARIAADVARALGAAHARGFVHRDVKPGNILISRDGRVKVTDFGIARAVAEAQMTLPGTTLGSVHYFSPEQARGEPATAASDIYSLGIVLYELLSGRRPWEGDSAAAIAIARLSGPPPAPSEARPGLPPALDAIVRKALARDPADRFESAIAMAAALDSFLAESAARGPDAPRAPSEAPPAAVAVTAAGESGAPAPPPSVAVPAAGPRTVGAGVARTTPRPPAYPREAYAGRQPAPAPRPPRATEDEQENRSGASAWAWLAGVLALVILAGLGFAAFQYLSGRPTPSSAATVTVPDFRGMTFDQASVEAERQGLRVEHGPDQENDQAIGKILAQDPPPQSTLDRGGTVTLTVGVASAVVEVPDLTRMSEAQAGFALAQRELQPGEKHEEASETVERGLIIHQDPLPLTRQPKGTPISYWVSTGPTPTPTPGPTPTPTATPPPPTPTPTPLFNVPGFQCLTLGQAKRAITASGFTLGTVDDPTGGSPDDSWLVIGQDPQPGDRVPGDTTIDLLVGDPSQGCS